MTFKSGGFGVTSPFIRRDSLHQHLRFQEFLPLRRTAAMVAERVLECSTPPAKLADYRGSQPLGSYSLGTADPADLFAGVTPVQMFTGITSTGLGNGVKCLARQTNE
jgi:hypothetical protein